MFNSKYQTAFLALTLIFVAFGFQQQAAAGHLPGWVFGIPLGCDKCDDPNGGAGSVKVTIQQASNLRYVDAHVDSGQDYRLVTRPRQNNDTQRWILKSKGHDRFTIQQASNLRYVDAHVDSGQDFRLVTRPRQNNDTQRWILKSLGNDKFTIQQASNLRYVDAHVDSGQDFRLVTRPRQKNDTQRWVIRKVD